MGGTPYFFSLDDPMDCRTPLMDSLIGRFTLAYPFLTGHA